MHVVESPRPFALRFHILQVINDWNSLGMRLSCIILNANQRMKMGEAWERGYTIHWQPSEHLHVKESLQMHFQVAVRNFHALNVTRWGNHRCLWVFQCGCKMIWAAAPWVPYVISLQYQRAQKMESTIPYSPVPKSHALSHKEKRSGETGQISWASMRFCN